MRMMSRDVGMVQRREELCFALKPRQPIHVLRKALGQDFERDLALQPRVARAIHLAHPAGAKRGESLIRPSRVPARSDISLEGSGNYRGSQEGRIENRPTPDGRYTAK